MLHNYFQREKKKTKELYQLTQMFPIRTMDTCIPFELRALADSPFFNFGTSRRLCY